MSLSAEAISNMIERVNLSLAVQLRKEFQDAIAELKSQPGPSTQGSDIHSVVSQLRQEFHSTIQELRASAPPVEKQSDINVVVSQLREEFQSSLQQLKTPGPSVQRYEEIAITSRVVGGNMRLDLPKSMHEFSGVMDKYPSWRQSAKAAIKPYQPYVGSDIYYQAVAIIRNKITGSADMVLSSFSTPLNFDAILARLDHTYSDKRPLYLLEQELSTLRQGRFSIPQFYDMVEKQLTLITNKAIMQYGDESVVLKSLNEKYRDDALRIFISGIKRPIGDTLFASQPKDLPSALALAQELESNRQRYNFAAAFANSNSDREHTSNLGKSPHYKVVNKTTRDEAQSPPEPMDVDPSTSRFRQNSGKNNNFRSKSSNNNFSKRHQLNTFRVEKLKDSSVVDILQSKACLPYVQHTLLNGEKIKLLLDTGAERNYVKNLPFLVGVSKLKNDEFDVHSIHGETRITAKCQISIMGRTSDFYVLSEINDMDGIIGYRFLKEINAMIDVTGSKLYSIGGIQEVFPSNSTQINLLQDLDYNSIPEEGVDGFKKIVTENQKAFADPNEALPYNTNIVATIKTTTDEAIYSRSYPYQMTATKFVNSEVETMLRDGIIRKSSSPYNNPIWVVNKKGVDEMGNPKLRLVIDFRKLNAKTVSDKYPIPDTSVILSNLGKSKYYSTLDLKSGFHQILLSEKDRKKTAFSVNNGKYEYCRMPFGLKNAPSIFQRAIDDVLRDDIGVRCHVYIDDVIIFSSDIQSHLKDIEIVIKKLRDANMRISLGKCNFFKTQLEFLGFVVSENGLKTADSKVSAILNFKEPTTIKGLRSFLGLSGYYRRFIRDYAKIAKPLTQLLRGENSNVSAKKSEKKKITLLKDAQDAFNKLKQILVSEDVTLRFPDFSRPFELTTDASSVAIGAVLSQDKHPITFVSRTLSATEQNYATNEREMLAIVWALQSLRNYLYGVNNLHIYTDHQPLTFAISDRNPNTKLKRWKSFIEEFTPTFHYKPGSQNVVADALSRQYIQNLTGNGESSGNCYNSEVSLSQVIRTVSTPINCFKSQIILSVGKDLKVTTIRLFNGYLRHEIDFSNTESLYSKLKEIVDAKVVNGVHCSLEILGKIQNDIINLFPSVRFKHTEKIVMDLINENDQLETIAMEHNRAHRSAKENYDQILDTYFFPGLRKEIKKFVSNCKICVESKYQRHPKRQIMKCTPLPKYPGEILHMDIYSTQNNYFLTCIDKFSKYALVEQIDSRSIVDIKIPLTKIIGFFKNPKTLVTDNEPSLCSNVIQSLIRDHFGMSHHKVPAMHSTSNGQVERFHSTLAEISRAIKKDMQLTDLSEIIQLALIKYNNSIHSVTKARPIDLLWNISDSNKLNTEKLLLNAQKAQNNYHNKKRVNRKFKKGQEIFVKRNKRCGNKLSNKYDRKNVQKDLGTAVLVDGKEVHKDNIR